MKIFKVSQDENSGYDTYDSIVVAAPDEQTARGMSPSNGKEMTKKEWNYWASSWCSAPDKVTVVYLGDAAEGVEQGIICASFNAG